MSGPTIRRRRPGAPKKARATRGPVLRARRGAGTGRARAAVPNSFTLMNLLAGFFSLIQTAAGNLEAAAWLVVLAAFFDLFDGILARMVGVSSEFGLELDSLADVVSFGVAPSFLLYEFGLDQLGPLWGALLASLPALFGALRLAHFNTKASSGEKSAEFVGLPIPAQAGTVVVFILTFAAPERALFFDVLSRRQLSFVVMLVAALSVLMVLPIKFPALPQPSRANLRTYRVRFLLFGTALLLGVALQEIGLLIAALVYLCIGIGKALVWAFQVATTDEEPTAREAPPPVALAEPGDARSFAPSAETSPGLRPADADGDAPAV